MLAMGVLGFGAGSTGMDGGPEEHDHERGKCGCAHAESRVWGSAVVDILRKFSKAFASDSPSL